MYVPDNGRCTGWAGQLPLDIAGLKSIHAYANFVKALSSYTQLTAFSQKITQNPLPIASGHDVIHIPSPISYPVSLL